MWLDPALVKGPLSCESTPELCLQDCPVVCPSPAVGRVYVGRVGGGDPCAAGDFPQKGAIGMLATPQHIGRHGRTHPGGGELASVPTTYRLGLPPAPLLLEILDNLA